MDRQVCDVNVSGCSLNLSLHGKPNHVLYMVLCQLGKQVRHRGALPKCVGLQAMREGIRYSVAACNSRFGNEAQ